MKIREITLRVIMRGARINQYAKRHSRGITGDTTRLRELWRNRERGDAPDINIYYSLCGDNQRGRV